LAAATQLEPVRPESTPLRFAPELELLLACSQPASGCEPDLGSILAMPLNWDSVLRLANDHRLLPALHSALHGRGDVPASIQSAIAARLENHQRRVLRFTAELARVAGRFERDKIAVLAHKGAALGQLLYGDSAMRQFGDLDFLVRPADMTRVRSALQELDYVAKLQLSPRQENEYLHSGYEHVFGLGRERNLVEVQWQIVPRFYAIDFDMEALFARSVELDVDGLRPRTLGDEDQMLVLCVHAAKHQWAQLGMLRDIATLAGLDLDWEWIEAEARRLGIAKIMAVSLRLAGSLFARDLAALPAFREEIGSVTKAVAAIERQISAGVETDTESLRYFHDFMHLRERWSDRLRMAWRLAATPSVGEWQAVRLPDSLFSLYRGVRLLRLLSGSAFPRRALSHRQLNDFGQMQRGPPRALLNLLAATEAIGDDQPILRCLAHCG
jgi:hypothetical protein